MGGTDKPSPLEAATPPEFIGNAEQIRVPFPPESDLSGIGRKQETHLWYKRTFDLPAG